MWHNRPANLSNSVKKRKIRAITPFKVIQGHRDRCQSKARLRLPIRWLIVTDILSRTVSELSQLIDQILGPGRDRLPNEFLCILDTDCHIWQSFICWWCWWHFMNWHAQRVILYVCISCLLFCAWENVAVIESEPERHNGNSATHGYKITSMESDKLILQSKFSSTHVQFYWS